jgi:Sec-independent protein translocase protein TatA
LLLLLLVVVLVLLMKQSRLFQFGFRSGRVIKRLRPAAELRASGSLTRPSRQVRGSRLEASGDIRIANAGHVARQGSWQKAS